MQERRLVPRLRAYKGGRINPRGFAGMDCVIRNLSDAGACLAVDSARVPVDEFYLVIKPEYLTRKCKVAWRKPQQMGVRFL
jgi:hypothetical protein